MNTLTTATTTTAAVTTSFRCWGRRRVAIIPATTGTTTTTTTVSRISTFSSSSNTSSGTFATANAAPDALPTDIFSTTTSELHHKHAQQCSSLSAMTTTTTMMRPSLAFCHRRLYHRHHPSWIVIPSSSVSMMTQLTSFSTTASSSSSSSTSKRRKRKRRQRQRKREAVAEDDGHPSSTTTWSTTSPSPSSSDKKKDTRTRGRRRNTGRSRGSGGDSRSSESMHIENTTARKKNSKIGGNENNVNNSSNNKEVFPAPSSLEEHERKVAAIQARILQQKQRKEIIAPPGQQQSGPAYSSSSSSSSSSSMVSTSEPPAPTVAIEEGRTSSRPTITGSSNNDNNIDSGSGRFSPDEMNILFNSIHHWLSKNPSFFHSTMEALDLKSLNQQNQQKDNVDGSIDSSQMYHPNNVTNHPLQALYDQYRRLYYDSIPDFRTEMEQALQSSLTMDESSSRSIIADDDPTCTLGVATKTDIAETDMNKDKANSLTTLSPLLLHSLQELKSAGFADPKWSRSFGRVRGYQINKESLSRHHSRQLREIQLRQDELRKEREKLRDLEEMDQLLQIDINDDHHYSLSSEKSFGDEKQDGINYIEDHDGRKDNKSLDEGQQDQASAKREQTFFQHALGMVSWIWSSKDASASTSRERVSETKLNKNRNDDERARAEVAIKKQKRDKRLLTQSNRLQKRIDRKHATVRQIEEEINDAIEKLEELNRTLDEMQSPMSDEEFALGQEVLARTREPICSTFAQYISNRHTHLIDQYQALETKTDLTKPHEWYGHARLDKRKIIFHGGPTNSGKTYSALQRLKEAKQGLYLGPLRLLAAEIYETLTADAVYTNLYTGQERRDVPFSTHASATVEMASFEKEYDVVVIDEIQMIADDTRGAAWTKALLGLRCKEIHVCGGIEAKDIVEKLARDCGDDFEINEYERFSKLMVAKKSLASDPKSRAYKNVMPGDCIVAFSRNDIFAIKREIENSTGYKCSVIYGKLPPEVRAEQARKFNDPNSDHQVLVASDAIGMGLNLNIRRIIFNSVFKFNGDDIVRLSHSEIKQIAGRAGRRNSPYPNGEVTSRDPRDLPYIRRCLSTDIRPVEKAAILPTAAHIEQFTEALSAYQLDGQDSFDLHDILSQFSSMATVKGDFFLGRQHELSTIAKHIRNVPLTLKDAYTFCLSPTNESSLGLLESFAMKYARGQTSGLPSRPVPKPAKSFDDLSHLCSIYSDADLFLWLQWKFPPSNAMEQAAAMAKKEKTLRYINQALLETDKLKLEHDYLQQAQRHRKTWESVNGPSEKIGPDLSELDEDYVSDNDFYGDDSDEEDNERQFVYS